MGLIFFAMDVHPLLDKYNMVTERAPVNAHVNMVSVMYCRIGLGWFLMC